MKRLFILLFAVSAMILSCVKSDTQEESKDNNGGSETGLKELTFKGILDAYSKDPGISVSADMYWTRNDEVGIWDGKAWRIFKARTTETESSLKGEAEESDSYIALYPYDAKATYEAGLLSTTLPSEQVALKGGEIGFIGLAASKVSAVGDMHFSNVSSAFAFEVGSDGITSVEIRTAGPKIAGAIDLSFDDKGLPKVNPGDDGSQAITVRPASGSFEKGVTYFAACRPFSADAGLTVLAYQGTTPIVKSIAGPINASMGKMFNLGTVGENSSDGSEAILGKWQLVRYGSRAADDVDGAYIWWSDANGKTLGASEDDVLTFKSDGVLEISLGEDGKSFSESEGDFAPSLNNPGWKILKEGSESYMKFSGGAYPLAVANADGIDASWHIVNMGSGEIQLEIFRNNDGEDGWFQVVLRPVGVSSFSRVFQLGDFGIDSTDANEGWYTLNIDEYNGESTFDGFKWHLAVDTEDIYYVYSNCIRIGVGHWHAKAETITPNQVTFSTSDIPGEIKTVYIKVSHNNSRDTGESAPDVDVKASVGGLPFGTAGKVVHNPDGPLTYTFSSPISASGPIAIDIVRNKGVYGLYISEIGVNYQN